MNAMMVFASCEHLAVFFMLMTVVVAQMLWMIKKIKFKG